MRRAKSIVRGLLFPPKCVCCRERLPYDATLPFCKTCSADWERETLEVCGFCQKPVLECLCSTSYMKRSYVPILFKLAYYKAGTSGAPNRLIFRMKESASDRLYSFVATRLAKRISEYLQKEKIPLSDCILTYAPRHRRALRLSGTDQAEQLARKLAKELGIKVLPAITRRPIKNKVQKKLNATERIRNAKSAFARKKGIDLTGKTLLLVDDTVTTGATMGVCASLLKEAGAARVLGVSIALDEIGRYPKETDLSTKPYF